MNDEEGEALANAILDGAKVLNRCIKDAVLVIEALEMLGVSLQASIMAKALLNMVMPAIGMGTPDQFPVVIAIPGGHKIIATCDAKGESISDTNTVKVTTKGEN